jgi:hypothetical protein
LLSHPRLDRLDVRGLDQAGGDSGDLLLTRVRSVILLGGAVRHTELTIATGRVAVDLPLDSRLRILDHWIEHAAGLSAALGARRLPLRLVLDRAAPQPQRPAEHERAALSIERDSQELRGTGGVLHDVTLEYGDDDYVLVASAAQLLLRPLAEVSRLLARRAADVALLASSRGRPSGLFLVRCGCLREVSSVGFVDFKEQALPRIAEHSDVRVVSCDDAVCLPVRTFSDYLEALAVYHDLRSGRAGAGAPAGAAAPLVPEDCFSRFGVVEEGAEVDPSARLHDAVVLRDSTVGRGAAVIRSVVCKGASVAPGDSVFNALVCARLRSPERAAESLNGRSVEPSRARPRPSFLFGGS